jgi:hypothetical protein
VCTVLTRLLYTVGLLQSLLVGGGALGTVVSSDTGSFVPAYFGSFGAEDAAQSTLTACADAVLLSETGTTATTAGTATTGNTGAAATAAAGADVYSYADDDVDGCCADYASQSSDAAVTVAAAAPQLQGILALLVARVVAVGYALAAASKASHSSANATAGSATVHRDSTEQGSALRVCKGYS